MCVLRSFARRVLIISATLATVWIVSAAFGGSVQETKHSQRPYFKPACDGLPCRSNHDCGSRCACASTGETLGVCAARPGNDLPVVNPSGNLRQKGDEP